MSVYEASESGQPDGFSAFGVYLTVDEVAEGLGITKKTAYDWLHSSQIPSYRIGSRWLILRDEVREQFDGRE